MFKLDLEKAEDPEIKLPTSVGSSKNQDSEKMHRKGVRRVRLLQLDECRAETKKAFAREAADAVPSAYEGLLRLGDDEGALSVYLQKCKGYLKILILMCGDDGCGFIEVESDNETLNSLLNF